VSSGLLILSKPFVVGGYMSKWSCCFIAPISCLAGKVRGGKKACV